MFPNVFTNTPEIVMNEALCGIFLFARAGEKPYYLSSRMIPSLKTLLPSFPL
jgi:hypothetical protein